MVRVGPRATFALGARRGSSAPLQAFAGVPFFSAHFASTSLCFFFGSLQVLLAEEAEARPFRAVPTSRKAAAHVALPPVGSPLPFKSQVLSDVDDVAVGIANGRLAHSVLG